MDHHTSRKALLLRTVAFLAAIAVPTTQACPCAHDHGHAHGHAHGHGHGHDHGHAHAHGHAHGHGHAHADAQSHHDEGDVAVDQGQGEYLTLLLLTVVATLGVSFISLLGMLTVRLLGDRVLRVQSMLAAFGAGSILSSALMIFLPEAIEHLENAKDIGLIVLIGTLCAMCTELLIHCFVGHSHDLGKKEAASVSVPTSPPVQKQSSTTSVQSCVTSDEVYQVSEVVEMSSSISPCQSSMDSLAWNCLIGDALHNLVDGTLIGTAMMSKTPMYAFYVAFMISLHELPQEVAELCILLHAGWPMKKALIRNALSTTTIVVGGLIGAILVSNGLGLGAENYLIGFVAGQFLYISLGQLLPSLSNMPIGTSRAGTAAAFTIGIASAAVIARATEHAHSHGH